jgi:repressor LexA
MSLTKRQFEVLEWIRKFMREKGYSPSFQEMGSGLGMRSLATVHKHLFNLERKGYIKRDYNRSRSIELTKTRRWATAEYLGNGHLSTLRTRD